MARSFSESFNIGRALSHGWSAFKKAPIPLLVGSVVMQCTQGGTGGGNYGGGGTNWDNDYDDLDFDFEQWEHLGTSLWSSAQDSLHALAGALPTNGVVASFGGLEGPLMVAVVAGVVFLVLLLGLAVFALRTWVSVGYLRLHRQVLSTGQGDFVTLFGGADAFWRMVVWSLLNFVVVLGALAAACLPGGAVLGMGMLMDVQMLTMTGAIFMVLVAVPVVVYVGLGLFFGGYVVALDGSGAMDALRRSWDLVRGNRLQLFVFLLVMGVVHMAGILACCVGIFVTRAITNVATTEAYLLFTRPAGELEEYCSQQESF